MGVTRIQTVHVRCQYTSDVKAIAQTKVSFPSQAPGVTGQADNSPLQLCEKENYCVGSQL